MPRCRLRIAEEFSNSLAEIYSERVLGQIRKLLELLQDNPELGSANVRESLVKLYGKDIRKLPVSKFVIIYRRNEDVIDVLALVYGPTVI